MSEFHKKTGFLAGDGFWWGQFLGENARKVSKSRHGLLSQPISCLRYQNVRLGKWSRGHGSAYFAIGLHSSLFSPFFLLSGDSFWGKMGKKSQNGGKVEKKTTLQADSKICPTMVPYLTFRDGHFDTSTMKIG